MTPASWNGRGVLVPDVSTRSAAVAREPDTSTRATRHSLRSNFGWTLVGNVIYAGCQWLILVVIARLSSPREVGQFALALAVTAPIFMFTGLQLRGVQATDATRQFLFRDYLAVRAIGMAAALAVCGGLVLLSGFDLVTGLVVAAIAISKAVEGISDACYGALQQRERMREIAISLVLRGTFSVASVAVALRLTRSLPISATALAAAWSVILVLHDLPAAIRVLRERRETPRPRFDSRSVTRIAALALPLGIVMMLISLRTNIPRYFLERSAGAADLGIFAALSSLIAAGTLVISALGQSAMPRLARHFAAGELDAFRTLMFRLLAIGATIGLAGNAVAWLWGSTILRRLFGAEYATHQDVLLWLTSAGGAAYVASFLGYGLTAARRFRVQLPIFVLTCCACAGASWFLVPHHGLIGAAWAWGIAVGVELGAMFVIFWWTLGEPPRSAPKETA